MIWDVHFLVIIITNLFDGERYICLVVALFYTLHITFLCGPRCHIIIPLVVSAWGMTIMAEDHEGTSTKVNY